MFKLLLKKHLELNNFHRSKQIYPKVVLIFFENFHEKIRTIEHSRYIFLNT